MGAKHIIGDFKGFLEGAKAFMNPKAKSNFEATKFRAYNHSGT
jgi:hypothetical protein